MKSRSAMVVLLLLSLAAAACAAGEADDAAVMASTVERPTNTSAETTALPDDDASPPSSDAQPLAAKEPEPETSTVAPEDGPETSASSVADRPDAPGSAATDDAEQVAVQGDERSNDALLATTTTTTVPSSTSVSGLSTTAPTTGLPDSSTSSSPTTTTTTTRPVSTTIRSTTVRPSTSTTRARTPAPAPSTTTTTRPSPVDTSVFPRSPVVRSGAQVLADSGFAGLEGKRVGIIVNHVSRVGSTHLIDVFDRAPDVELVAIFGPEHGVRGTADAGEKVSDDIDERSGAPILSLYGNTRKPTPEMLEGIDVLVFDLQDVGTRFYTYISTMGLAMQAAAAADIEFVVLDRPNPLGGLDTEGFTRLAAQDSFIGQYPIPATYALTSGELARAIKGERWMSGLAGLDLRVVELDGWSRRMQWPDTGMTWVGPSPGLPTFEAALAYPGTVLLEATTVSYGTGTYQPFSTAGAPWIDKTSLADDLNGRDLPGVWFLPVSYTPRVIEGLSVRPRLEGELVHGVRYVFTDYRTFDPVRTGVHLLDAIRNQAVANDIDGWIDRPKTFDLLSGNPTLRRMLLAGDEPDKIVSTWSADNSRFAAVQSRYRLYR